MPKATVKSVIAQAKQRSKEVKSESEAIALLAVMHPDAGTNVAQVKLASGKAQFSLATTSDIFQKAGKAFERAKALVKKIICKDLQYCKNKDATSTWLNDHLPEIVGLLLKGTPKGVIAKILSLLGLGAASWASVVAIVVAWLLKAELDNLCDC